MQPALTNSFTDGNGTNWATYSDLDVCGAHGNGSSIGGGPAYFSFLNYLSDTFTPLDLQTWCIARGRNWRMRRIELWSCYSGNPEFAPVDPLHHGTTPLTFMAAAGIRDARIQNRSYIRKNCALAFHDLVPENGYNGNLSITTGEVVEFLDESWVCGPNAYPGGCDPSYSFSWAVQETVNQYAEMGGGVPGGAGATVFGYLLLPYTTVYDDEILMLDNSHVKNPAN